MKADARSVAVQENELPKMHPAWFSDTVTDSEAATKERDRWSETKVASKIAGKFQKYPLLWAELCWLKIHIKTQTSSTVEFGLI